MTPNDRRSAVLVSLSLVLMAACADPTTAPTAGVATARLSGSTASGGGGGGGGGGGTVKADQIKVSKCFWQAGGAMLIKAASSDPTALLFAYTPNGALIGEVQNGGGSRYGGTVMGYTPNDPGIVTIRSSAGGSIDVPTGPFVL